MSTSRLLQLPQELLDAIVMPLVVSEEPILITDQLEGVPIINVNEELQQIYLRTYLERNRFIIPRGPAVLDWIPGVGAQNLIQHVTKLAVQGRRRLLPHGSGSDTWEDVTVHLDLMLMPANHRGAGAIGVVVDFGDHHVDYLFCDDANDPSSPLLSTWDALAQRENFGFVELLRFAHALASWGTDWQQPTEDSISGGGFLNLEIYDPPRKLPLQPAELNLFEFVFDLLWWFPSWKPRERDEA